MNIAQNTNNDDVSFQVIKDRLKEQNRVELLLYGWQFRYPGKSFPDVAELAEIADAEEEIVSHALTIVTQQVRRPYPYRKPGKVYREHYNYHASRRKSLGLDPEPTLKEIVATSEICERTIARYRKRHLTEGSGRSNLNDDGASTM